jgi:hypothetical protein
LWPDLYDELALGDVWREQAVRVKENTRMENRSTPNKQDTVTTSSTEAELLALSQTAKEAIFLSRLLQALIAQLNEPLTFDNPL